ncbi:MAG: electron transfer flavoprotein subunit alpha/FixB family protein [Chloroflexota bacterium]
MNTILAVGELVAGTPTRLTLELATLARTLADAAGVDAEILLAGPEAAAAAAAVAAHGPAVRVLPDDPDPALHAGPLAARVATDLAAGTARWVLLPATPAGRAVAGALAGAAGIAVLSGATAVTWADGAPRVTQAPWGGRIVTESTFAGGPGAIVVRPGAIAAGAAATPGAIATVVGSTAGGPAPVVVERRAAATADRPIEEARIVVGAGRGVAGPDGVALLGRLADALGGSLGATRAAVDSGWIDYARQIGQTGRSVKPDLYLACGVSGAIQHKVGVQTAGTIVAINRDADAPIAEFSDLLVVGDLFAIVPALIDALAADDRG